jgi:photosystem II stability/assembly factor-like uncharacterized protein
MKAKLIQSFFDYRLAIVGGLLVLVLLGFCPHVSAQDVDVDVDPTNLNGIPGPYCFENYCMPTRDEIWIVGGQGQVLHKTGDKPFQEFRLIKGEDVYKTSFYGVYFNASGVGWVVGDGGVIFHSGDGGKNWIRQISGTAATLKAVTCVDEKHCWAVGDDGIALRTVDGGDKWTSSRNDTTDGLDGVGFVNLATGWAVGDHGLLLSTKDGGITWTSQRICVASDSQAEQSECPELRAVEFIDEKLGFVAGWDGIARTTDGGRTWEITSIRDTAFVGLVSHDGKKVWAVNKGDNYCSENAGQTWIKCRQAAIASK